LQTGRSTDKTAGHRLFPRVQGSGGGAAGERTARHEQTQPAPAKQSDTGAVRSPGAAVAGAAVIAAVVGCAVMAFSISGPVYAPNIDALALNALETEPA